MLDPVPPPPRWLSSQIKDLSNTLSFPTLPSHVHEIVVSFLFYQFVQSVFSPVVSSYLFPRIYPSFNQRTKINWDVHVVSLVQSCSINAAALWVMYVDEERMGMSGLERVYGYTGGCGMIQGLAAGYFLWDLVVTSRNIGIFGVGMWAHAVCALCVFSFGFRPFLNFYGPTFILYELSSPFLNIHWFLDKLHLTGSRYQWYNGLVLLASFFGCRLVWGTYQSIRVYQDVWAALHLPVNSAGELGELSGNVTSVQHQLFVPRDGGLCLEQAACVAAQSEVMKYVGKQTKGVPVWLAVTYLSSNVVLNSLNFYWFGKMIETVRKRFEKRPEEAETGSDEKAANGHQPNGSRMGTGTGKRGSVRRRRSSLVLDVADELERDERLHLTMDGSAEVDGQPIANALNLSTEQRRLVEGKPEADARANALENHISAADADADATTTATATAMRNDPSAARRR